MGGFNVSRVLLHCTCPVERLDMAMYSAVSCPTMQAHIPSLKMMHDSLAHAPQIVALAGKQYGREDFKVSRPQEDRYTKVMTRRSLLSAR